MSERTEKIASTLHKELAPLFIKYFDQKKYGLITIKEIKVLDDLSESRVFLSVQNKPGKFFSEVNKKSWRIQKEVMDKGRIIFRRMPKLIFLSSKGLEPVEKVLNLLDSL